MSTQTDFINLIKAGAQESQKKYGILASLTIAQAADESGWGQHVIANNLFGIKANGSTGPCVTVGTKEFVNGEYINTTATFRAYPSLAASVEDQASFIASNARYKNILHVTDAQKACELIQQDGYATDPDYATKLYDIIKEYKLTQYDTPDPSYSARGSQTHRSGKARHILYSQHNEPTGRHRWHCKKWSDIYHDCPRKWLAADQLQRQNGLHRPCCIQISAKDGTDNGS